MLLSACYFQLRYTDTLFTEQEVSVYNDEICVLVFSFLDIKTIESVVKQTFARLVWQTIQQAMAANKKNISHMWSQWEGCMAGARVVLHLTYILYLN